MSSGLPRRILKETERLMADPPPGISGAPANDNLRYFAVNINGPESSPYEGPSSPRIRLVRFVCLYVLGCWLTFGLWM